MALRFLIDENLSPRLAEHLRGVHGYDAVHVNEIGLSGASDSDVLIRAVAEDRVIMTADGNDFRRLGRRMPSHPGLAVLRHAAGRQRQIAVGTRLVLAIDAAGQAGRQAGGRLFESDDSGDVREYRLP